MFDNVLIGVNDVDAGATAVALATGLGASGLTLAAVDRQAAATVLAEVGARAGVEAELVTLHGRSAGRALSAVARERGCDLLVLGPPRRGELAHLAHGGTARLALHHAHCPVAVAPRGLSVGDQPRSVAVGYDGSPSARAALAVAAAWAEEHAAALTIVVAWHTSALREDDASEAASSVAVDRARAQLADALAGLPDRTAGRVVRGRSQDVLTRAAETVDLLVVGAGDRSPVRRALIGSSADWVLHHAGCAVLVVPAPSGAGAAHGDLSTTAGA